jgi:hypothetical protein
VEVQDLPVIHQLMVTHEEWKHQVEIIVVVIHLVQLY